MDEKRYRLQTTPGISLPARDADTLLSLADGECALLYLLLLRNPDAASDEAALGRALGRTPQQIRAAAEKLRGAGLLGGARALPPAEELPEYRAEDIVRRSHEDPGFQGLLAEAQARLGHALSGADMKTLFGIYDRLGLPCEVIMLLINRCAESAKKRYGEGRLPTMRAIEKEAYVWCNRELVTIEQAEAYLAALDAREREGEELTRLLQISGRQPTPSERKYMDDWLALGFSREALALAYDRTMIGTGGKLVWKYMDTILRSWHGKGLHTPSEIERGDTRSGARRPGTPRPAASAGVAQADDLDQLERRLSKKEG